MANNNDLRRALSGGVMWDLAAEHTGRPVPSIYTYTRMRF